MTALALLVLTAVVSAALAHHYTRPLRKLDAAMRSFAAGRLDTRVENRIGRADAEVEALARMFDRMADQISSLITRQRRLFHDVSHELRSPLARIDVALEIAERDPARRGQMMDRIRLEVLAIDRLVESLLTYARYERGAGLTPVPTVLNQVVGAAVENVAFEAQKTGVTVRWDDRIGPECVLQLDADALQSALENILRNGLRHTPPETELGVLLERTNGGAVRIACRDCGPGMDPEELAHVFDPFVRGSGEKTGTGFGLGLAIARSVVQAHGGSISARNRPEGGFEVTIELPGEDR